MMVCPSSRVHPFSNYVLSKMHAYFSDNVGRHHVFVLHRLGGAGKSQIAFKFIEECQVNAPVSAPLMFNTFTSLQLTLFILHYQRFSEIFFIDASKVETITADLRSIAVTKGIGDSENDMLNWLSRQCNKWLLLFNNADNTMLNLQDYFSHCSHGNILITSRNYNICQHATGQQSHCKVSGLMETEAGCLLLNIVGINDDKMLAKTKYWH
jgi:hypothetical protein